MIGADWMLKPVQQYYLKIEYDEQAETRKKNNLVSPFLHEIRDKNAKNKISKITFKLCSLWQQERAS